MKGAKLGMDPIVLAEVMNASTARYIIIFLSHLLSYLKSIFFPFLISYHLILPGLYSIFSSFLFSSHLIKSHLISYYLISTLLYLLFFLFLFSSHLISYYLVSTLSSLLSFCHLISSHLISYYLISTLLYLVLDAGAVKSIILALVC